MLLQASTLPVVVISSSNQVVSAWASIMWCSMLCTSEPMVDMHYLHKTSSGIFSLDVTSRKGLQSVCPLLQNLSLFVEPPSLPWTQLSQLLSWQFLTVGQRELDQDQLSQLREKFVGRNFQ